MTTSMPLVVLQGRSAGRAAPSAPAAKPITVASAAIAVSGGRERDHEADHDDTDDRCHTEDRHEKAADGAVRRVHGCSFQATAPAAAEVVWRRRRPRVDPGVEPGFVGERHAHAHRIDGRRADVVRSPPGSNCGFPLTRALVESGAWVSRRSISGVATVEGLELDLAVDVGGRLDRDLETSRSGTTGADSTRTRLRGIPAARHARARDAGRGRARHDLAAGRDRDPGDAAGVTRSSPPSTAERSGCGGRPSPRRCRREKPRPDRRRRRGRPRGDDRPARPCRGPRST